MKSWEPEGRLRPTPLLAILTLVGAAATPLPFAQTPTGSLERLKPVFALPAHVVAGMQDAVAISQAADGDYLVLDRRAHTVFRVNRTNWSVRRLMQIGHEPGRLLRPMMMSLGSDDIVAVMDAPNGLQRIQYFSSAGMLIGGFFLPILGSPNLIVGDQVVTGAGAMAFTGTTFYVSEPAWGSLVAELDTTGTVLRHIGQLRPTLQESDKELHLALNTGLPVVDPTGGVFFVFQTGVPMFRKYDAAGRLVLERHIEGVEIDPVIQALPNRWQARPAGARPFPMPNVRTAAADAHGHLWVALTTGHTYVYDRRGEKTRVLAFDGARPVRPTSLFFLRNGRVLVGPEGYEFDTSR